MYVRRERWLGVESRIERERFRYEARKPGLMPTEKYVLVVCSRDLQGTLYIGPERGTREILHEDIPTFGGRGSE